MRCLTVRQPWAWAIFNGKNIENRTAAWRYRGPLAIHAGAGWSERGDRSPLIHQAAQGRSLSGSLVTSAVIGVAYLVDIHPDARCCRPWGESEYVETGGRKRRNVMHLVLEDPRLLPEPVPCRGALGLWSLPADIAELCEGMLA